MNNLSQTRAEAKQLYLKRQRSKVIDQLKGASLEERKAVIRHIDGFLSSTTPEGKIFWLKIRREIERQIEREIKARKADAEMRNDLLKTSLIPATTQPKQTFRRT